MFGILVYSENMYYPNTVLNYSDIPKLFISRFSQKVQSIFLYISRTADYSPLFYLLLTRDGSNSRSNNNTV